MSLRRTLAGALLGGALLAPVFAGAAGAASPVTFVPHTATWKVLDNGTDQTPAPLPAATHFASPSYDDAAWTSHTVEANKVLGYGDNSRANFPTQTPNLKCRADIASTCGSGGAAKFITTYFRTTFDVADPSLVETLDLSVRRDDGVIVFLNGVEVWRSNMPAGAYTYTTWSTDIVDSTAEYTPVTITIPASALVSGTNVLAVELHQRDTTSSDITFAAVLSGTADEAPPVVVPEAPFAVLLPLGAGVAGLGAYAVLRRRATPAAAI